MSVRKLLEGDVDLILDYIRDNIATALTDLRTDRADAAVSTEPPPTQSYFRYPRAMGYRKPAVFVIGDSMQFLQGDGSNFVKAIGSINVTIAVEDRTADRLVTKCYRYMCALHELLEQTTLVSLDNKLKIVCKVIRADNSPLYALREDEDDAENVFTKEVALTLEVEHWESL